MDKDQIEIQQDGWHYTIVENAILDDLELSPVSRLLYVYLSKYADREKSCWPSQNTLSKKTGISKRQIIISLQQLINRGYVIKKTRKAEDGKNLSNVYVLKYIPPQIIAENPIKSDSAPPAPSENLPVHTVHQDSAPPAPKLYPIELQPEKHKDPLCENEKNGNEQGEISYQEILKSFKEICLDLPKPAKITTERKKHVNARIEGFKIGVEINWTYIFTKVHQSDFLNNRNQKEGNTWKADFDWILNENNMAKILEGKYDNHKPDKPNSSKKTDSGIDDLMQAYSEGMKRNV